MVRLNYHVCETIFQISFLFFSFLFSLFSTDDSTGDELVVPPAPLESQSNQPTKDEPSDSTDPSPDAFFPEPSIPTTPSITIEKVPTLKRSEVVESDVMSKEEEEEVATPPQAMGDKSRIGKFLRKGGGGDTCFLVSG